LFFFDFTVQNLALYSFYEKFDEFLL